MGTGRSLGSSWPEFLPRPEFSTSQNYGRNVNLHKMIFYERDKPDQTIVPVPVFVLNNIPENDNVRTPKLKM